MKFLTRSATIRECNQPQEMCAIVRKAEGQSRLIPQKLKTQAWVLKLQHVVLSLLVLVFLFLWFSLFFGMLMYNLCSCMMKECHFLFYYMNHND